MHAPRRLPTVLGHGWPSLCVGVPRAGARGTSAAPPPAGASPSFPGVDTDELDSNVEDWEEETIEFFVTEEVVPLGSEE